MNILGCILGKLERSQERETVSDQVGHRLEQLHKEAVLDHPTLERQS